MSDEPTADLSQKEGRGDDEPKANNTMAVTRRNVLKSTVAGTGTVLGLSAMSTQSVSADYYNSDPWPIPFVSVGTDVAGSTRDCDGFRTRMGLTADYFIEPSSRGWEHHIFAVATGTTFKTNSPSRIGEGRGEKWYKMDALNRLTMSWNEVSAPYDANWNTEYVEYAPSPPDGEQLVNVESEFLQWAAEFVISETSDKAGYVLDVIDGAEALGNDISDLTSSPDYGDTQYELDYYPGPLNSEVHSEAAMFVERSIELEPGESLEASIQLDTNTQSNWPDPDLEIQFDVSSPSARSIDNVTGEEVKDVGETRFSENPEYGDEFVSGYEILSNPGASYDSSSSGPSNYSCY